MKESPRAAPRRGARRARLRVLLRPAVLLPVLFAAALLAFVFSVSDLPRVVSRIRRIPPVVVGATLVLALVYLRLKLLEFRLLLRGLGIDTPARRLLLAFAVGEITLSIPAGVYAQNYMLRRLQGAGFARSAAATTLILAIETGLVFLALAIDPIPAWPWLRPLCIGLLAASLAMVALLLRLQGFGAALAQRSSPAPLRSLFRGIEELLTGLRRLSTPGVLAPSLILTAVYLSALAAAFLLVAHGVGADGFTFRQAFSVYAFSLMVVLVLGGVVPQLGGIELAGLGAAQAWGYGPSEGLAMMIGFRLVWTGAIWFWCVPAVALLWRELDRVAGDDLQKPVH